MKRTALRRKGKSPQAKLEEKLWDECKRIIREQYGNTCYTCGAKNLIGSNWHTGHMWAKGSLHALMKYDLRILRPQCYNCNMNYGGMGAVFIKNMERIEGKAYVKMLEKDRQKDKQVTLKSFDHYTKLLEEYRTIRL